MHHFVTEMCTRAHFCYKMVHRGIWGRFTVRFVRLVYWKGILRHYWTEEKLKIILGIVEQGQAVQNAIYIHMYPRIWLMHFNHRQYSDSFNNIHCQMKYNISVLRNITDFMTIPSQLNPIQYPWFTKRRHGNTAQQCQRYRVEYRSDIEVPKDAHRITWEGKVWVSFESSKTLPLFYNTVS